MMMIANVETLCFFQVEQNITRDPDLHSVKMSVEESLKYLDNTLAELDKVSNEPHVYESESDLLSEFGYASGYTELSVTSDSENHPKQFSGAARRRKSRQNRNQRYQADPILGDLESDSTNDGHLFASGVTPKTRTRTNSGQRRQRERRRVRRQNANRNSWTDSGLSLSKTDSQRSSHGENSPLKRARSKTSPADLDHDVERHSEALEDQPTQNEVEHQGTSPIQIENDDFSPLVEDIELPVTEVTQSTITSVKSIAAKPTEPDNSSATLIASDSEVNAASEQETKQEEHREMVFALSCMKQQEAISADAVSNKSLIPGTYSLDPSTSSLNPSINSLDPSTSSLNPSTKSSLDPGFINIKPTNPYGVITGTYSPKEKEIMQQVFENARKTSNEDPRMGERSSLQAKPSDSRVSPASRFPLPSHMDYPLCMYRNETRPKKEKKSGGILGGIRKLREGISNRRKPVVSGNQARTAHAYESPQPAHEETGLPPSKFVDKKKGLLRRIFKSNSNNGLSRSKPKSQVHAGKSGNFNRDRFGSSRSFGESIGQLWSRGSRARSQSMENLKNVFKRERGASYMKSATSSTSLAGKLPRSMSISSLIGRRGKPFMRHGSIASIAVPPSRQQTGFRRADSVRSLQGGFDIARLMHARNECYEENIEQQIPSHGAEPNTPFRGGWRPSSRASRRDTYYYEPQQCYEEDYGPQDNYYESEGPCSCCYDEPYADDGYYYSDYEQPRGHYHNKDNFYDSQSMASHQQHLPPSRQSFHQPSGYASSQNSGYYSPANCRAEARMVVAPLNVQVTQERQAQCVKLSRVSQVFDTMV